MELHQLRYFVKVAELLHFTKASEELYISQPALSQQIKQLEDELKVPLFYRKGRNTQLTQAGEIFLDYAKQTLSVVKQGKKAISDLRNEVNGTIKIGIMYSYFAPLVDLLPKFCNKYPNVSLSLHYGNDEDNKTRLLNSQLNLALTFGDNDVENQFDILAKFEAFPKVIVSKNHPFASKETVSIRELNDTLLALPTEENIIRSTMNKLFEKHKFYPFINTEINDANLLFDLVEKDKFVTIMTDTATYSRKDLVLIPLKEKTNSVQGMILVKKGTFISKATHIFIDEAIAILNSIRK
ncbi:LysR family transcriptional regulator [Chishuiella sp.]|uniref:LysR family transcriptional regulator n=1 Tax=Chishuiella sp. TaxID=1969467 RepID=UPI0028AEEAAA|nr:LysR family transcriptional regulator [Chishuiella sp.]